jgi:predicted ATP-dependent endonuclease of OLD family
LQLIYTQVKKYKSIDDSEKVKIDPNVTVVVGQNEAGKTAFLQALNKAYPFDKDHKYDIITDYPRKDYGTYQRIHKTNPDVVAELTYLLGSADIQRINEDIGINLIEEGFSFILSVKYDTTNEIDILIPEQDFINHIVTNSALMEAYIHEMKKAKTIKQLIEILEDLDLNDEGATFRDQIKGRFVDTPASPNDYLEPYILKKFIKPYIPEFIYFGDYNILPGKVNLVDLRNRIANGSQTEETKTTVSLLNLAGISLNDLMNPVAYEDIKAKLESISNSVTDKVFEYWTQNQDLVVEFDIRPDATEIAPYNNGDNLYIRIRNQRHRVTVPFDQRSKGFIWFFSFIVWFDNIKQDMTSKKDLILLLDEPGLSLHALAQSDFLKYIDDLSKEHQIIYTTHSPFMVPSNHLERVRMVEDRPKIGTKITDNISHSDQKTLFPLQAALGYSIAQNLFIARHNLLVEGPADLIYLRYFSNILESMGRVGLKNEITIIPVGGLDKLATFIALLNGNNLNFVVLHDYSSKPDERLEIMVVNKLINQKSILNFGMYRRKLSSDIEDMLSPDLYLRIFNDAYNKQLKGICLSDKDLPQGERIIERIGRYVKENNINLRPSGGFNHYLPASYLVSHPMAVDDIDTETINRFEEIFKAINKLLDDGE